MTIKFRKHYVTNGAIKARVRYCTGARIDKRICVTLYAKDWDKSLGEIFKDLYKDETDTMTDYFDKGKVTFFESNAFYAEAKKVADSLGR